MSSGTESECQHEAAVDHPEIAKPWLLDIVGGLTWLAAILIRLTLVPNEWWRWRDDAVITLSHARNLVEFGSIGVSPVDRVEGFSSPLQFILSSLAFLAFEADYRWFLDLQLVACLFITGYLLSRLLRFVLNCVGAPARRANPLAALLTLLAATFTALSWTTTGWIGSGMENSLAVVLSVAVITSFVGGRDAPGSQIRLGVLVGSLGLVRIEFPFMMLPLLWVLTLDVLRRKAPGQRTGPLVRILGPVVLIWAVVQAARYAYFGALMPNTGVVQGKQLGPAQVGFLIVLLATFVLLLAARSARTQSIGWGALAVFSLCIFGYYTLVDPQPAIQYLLALFMCLGLVQIKRLNRGQGPPFGVDGMFAAVAFIPVAQFLVMGPARLEPFRVGSLAVPVVCMWIVTTLARSVTVSAPSSSRRDPRATAWMRTALVLSIGLVLTAALSDRPRDMPWRISPSEDRILLAASSMWEEGADLDLLPIVANPDLGKLSFPKEAVIVDLGLLGDPLLTRISIRQPGLETIYLNRVATPDIVEVHGGWSCRFSAWLNSEEFRSGWTPMRPNWPPESQYAPDCPAGGQYTIWRRNQSDEHPLAREIAVSDDPARIVQDAVGACSVASSDPFRCEQVQRAVLRNSRHLLQEGQLGFAVEALRNSPSFALDREILERRRGWAERAYAEFLALSATAVGAR